MAPKPPFCQPLTPPQDTPRNTHPSIPSPSIVRRLAPFTLLGLLLLAPTLHANTPPPEPSSPSTHWAFSPLSTPPTPQPHSTPKTNPNLIDAWIQKALGQRQLKPSPPADPYTLLRRTYLNLIGLPPSPSTLATFASRPSSTAFSEIVEQLLASPRYGERWAQHWMDVVRYADTAGDNADYPVPEAARYRDYIIDSLNADKPYNQFIVEQLAGDVLASKEKGPRFAEQVIATGFLALSRRYATGPFELMHLTLEDAIETTSRTFLGMSFRCARCHDHKFDPITQQDYYGLYGIFASTTFPYAGSEEFQSKSLPRSGFIPLRTPEEAARSLEENKNKLELLRARLDQLDQQVKSGQTNTPHRAELQEQIAALRLELKRRERSGAHPDLPVAYAVSEGKPQDHPFQKKGEPDPAGSPTPRCIPRFFNALQSFHIAPHSSGRLELAQWIASDQNPLTARVLVNRVWHHHFGRGLVDTPSDLGMRSSPPAHRELLDALATDFMRNGWSIKHLHRLILHSQTWQQCSTLPPNAPEPVRQAWKRSLELDPDNRWLSRFTRSRLDAETLRDVTLWLSGQLNTNRPGPHPFPPIEEWKWTQHTPFKDIYPSSHRSVYLMRPRLQKHPYLGLFDAPDANTSTDVRSSAVLPQQALYLLNHEDFREAARLLARRIFAAYGTDSERIAAIHEWAWNRPPSPVEQERSHRYISEFQKAAAGASSPAGSPSSDAWESLARTLLKANAFHFID